MLDPEFVKMLVCPETKQDLTLASAEMVTAINAAIERRHLTNRGGVRVEEKIETALIRKDGTCGYPVRHGIPVLLVEEALELSGISGL